MVGFDPIYLMRSKLQNSFEAYYASGTGSKPTNNKYRIAETTQGNLDNTEAKIFDTNGKYVRHLCERETLLIGRSFNPTLRQKILDAL